jgi:hypothetical protein
VCEQNGLASSHGVESYQTISLMWFNL